MEGRAGRVAVAVWALLVAGVFAWGHALRAAGQETQDVLPPLYATPRLLTWQLLPAVAVAAAAVAWLPRLAGRLAWRPLLLTAWAATVSWACALAVSDGISALARPLTSQNEYLAGLGAVRPDPLRWLATFTDRLQSYPVHTKGHPPLPMLFLWLLDTAGLRGAGWAAAALIVIGASAVMAIAITLRCLAGEELARRALPFLVISPIALWIATAMDALFLGVGAWGTALLALAARHQSGPSPVPRLPPYTPVPRRLLYAGPTPVRRRLPHAATAAAGGGILLGTLPYLSYGLLPLLAVPLAVLVVTRPRRPVIAALLGGLCVVPLACTLAGFWWPDGVVATHQAYLSTGGSSRRPYLYFLVGDLGVLALLVGPAVASAVPSLVRSARGEHSALALLAGAALVGMLALDISGVTRGEVERIWVPYAAWVVAVAALRRPPARGWLAMQAATAIAVQALVLSAW